MLKMSLAAKRNGPALLVTFVLAGLWLFPSALNAHEHDRQHLLLINSYHPGLPWSQGLMRGLGLVFDDAGPALVMHVEYMDGIRHRQDDLFPVMKEYLGRKYEQVPLEVILTTDDVALDFLFLYRFDCKNPFLQSQESGDRGQESVKTKIYEDTFCRVVSFSDFLQGNLKYWMMTYRPRILKRPLRSILRY